LILAKSTKLVKAAKNTGIKTCGQANGYSILIKASEQCDNNALCVENNTIFFSNKRAVKTSIIFSTLSALNKNS